MNNDRTNIDPESIPEESPSQKPKRRPAWLRILKWTFASAAIIIALLAIAITAVLLYLTPERINNLVNKYGSEYLNADLQTQRIDLTFWSTFPKFHLQIDQLSLTSRSLNRLSAQQRDSLPADADSLLQLEHFSGGINILSLLAGKIELYDIQLTNPRINLFVVNDSINNFDILPPSESKPDSTAAPLPEIAIDRFAINGSLQARMRIPADSVDYTLSMHRMAISGNEAPTYRLGLSGQTSANMAHLVIPPIPFSIDGAIDWNQKQPSRVALHDFNINVIDIPIRFNATIDMARNLTVENLSLDIDQFKITPLLALIPRDRLGDLAKIDTDLNLQASMKLLQPFNTATDSLPTLSANLKASASRLLFDDLNLHLLDIDLNANIDGTDLNKSTVDINKFAAKGLAIDFIIKSKLSNLLSDPIANGTFEGSVAFNRLPRKLLSQLPATFTGKLKGSADYHFRLSDLTPKQFHRARLNGQLLLSDFRMAMHDGSIDTYIRSAVMKLGTNSHVSVADHVIDSLLTASLTIDTAAINAPGINIGGNNLSLNVGMRNIASSTDTTMINPIGLSVKAGAIALRADSGKTAMRLHDASIGATLRRYNSEARSPKLDLDIEAGRMGMRTPDLGAMVSDAKMTLTLHPRARRQISAKMQHRIDSLAALHPTLSSDSLLTMARALSRRKADSSSQNGRENIDFGVDNSLASWLRLWQLQGSLSAKRSGFYSTFFPTRNLLTDLDMSFSTDSVIIRNADLRSGRSDFHLSGSITNIRRAMTSKRHIPLEVDFTLRADTIDVNDLTATLIRGAANTAKSDSANISLISEAKLEVLDPQLAAEENADTMTGPLIIPSNIRASFNIYAKRILYGDIWFRDFSGIASVYDGALALQRLLASTDIGQVGMTALYSAPTPADIHFAAGIDFKHLDLHQILNEMPQIDSLMPMLHDIQGIVDAQLAITTDLDSLMNIRFNTLDMALRINGKDLVLLDSETFRTVSKWLLFKNKNRNVIDKMDVEITIHNGWLDLYPVIFDIDRYRLGVVGNNDLNFNLDYHIAVLKSPLPFKFGINIKGTPEKMKIRLGKARLNEKSTATSRHLTDTLRVNLIREIGRSFRRGLRSAGAKGLRMQHAANGGRQSAGNTPDDPTDTLNPADSAVFIKEGLLPPPPAPAQPDDTSYKKSKKKK